MSQNIRIVRAESSRWSETARETAQFGTVFSDHLFVADYEDGRWGEPQILPYGPLPLPPAPIGAHYGQAAF
ncbi:MAG TPA: branched chain amino acid aminotransferase, partial [Blastocatellia bacterium]|nr:branched chain amino acid aminotransferase [Blastocatellia bacterium]